MANNVSIRCNYHHGYKRSYWNSYHYKTTTNLQRMSTQVDDNCLYSDLKIMISVGLATIASSTYDCRKVIYGEKTLRVLCIGHESGSLPLFLPTKEQRRRPGSRGIDQRPGSRGADQGAEAPTSDQGVEAPTREQRREGEASARGRPGSSPTREKRR
ncbi:hypothetical protein Syun_014036 [Stephania yunnanensis]|uniref:Uncharacterized protein n=1 Tax=Stephania yunnanensis TaxID=152371 RepID=A0AAP0JIJ1_9MAGN